MDWSFYALNLYFITPNIYFFVGFTCNATSSKKNYMIEHKTKFVLQLKLAYLVIIVVFAVWSFDSFCFACFFLLRNH